MFPAVLSPNLPLTVSLGPWPLPVHALFDILAYFLGFRLYLRTKKHTSAALLSVEQQAWIFVGCIFGALIGSKFLAWLEAPALYWAIRGEPFFWTGGKSIVGGLLGGWAGVEVSKKILNIAFSTGDALVFPLILGMILGRIGCFLTGLPDHTHGLPASLPWAVDYGDGIPRHPAQLYEILFLLSLGIAFLRFRYNSWPSGFRFRLFLGAYCAWRFGVEWLKPREAVWAGLSSIQWTCLLALPLCIASARRLLSPQIRSPYV
jgi:prolipoprotein diacylglyceryltransferase